MNKLEDTVRACHNSVNIASIYVTGWQIPPHYPVPAIPTRVEYIFGYGLADGVFVRVEDYIVSGCYRDGMLVKGYPPIPYEYDYPDLD